ncbi:MAG: hypothetical protein KBD29_02350 [Candidatus Magasanikbacteria bacterium]|nr:hypothetical protein [Candidatus Magasanikbacteria bacterium]
METVEKNHHLEREKNKERREEKEGEVSEELKAAATRERAEYLIKEVKSTTKQVQNLVLHIQHVVAAINALKTQLQLTSKEDPSSVVQDAKMVGVLKQKIIQHKKELVEMKEDLIEALMKEEGNTSHTIKTKEEVVQIVQRIMNELSVE